MDQRYERLKKAARQELIVAEINAIATVRTSVLAQKLGVSNETVRRDIDELTERGLVARTYGGAAGLHVGAQPVLTDRTALAVEERRRIGALAADLLRPGDVVMVDSGSTTTAFAQALAQAAHPLTVITNSIGTANALADRPGARIILCPGDYSARERGIYGPETIAFLSRFNADAAFIGASGLTSDGPTDVETQACWVKRTMLSRAARAVLLADSSKFERKHLEIVCGWADLTDVVTDRSPPAALRDAIAAGGARLHVA